MSRDNKMDSDGVVKHVVLDSGAFLRNAPIQNIGENVYTIPEVVEEIKDKATKQRLQVLPYQLIYREPPPETIKAVTEFAKKTGDYGSLSAVDIRVMALTLQLEKENVGIDHIKTVPDKKVEWNSTTRALEKPTDIAGFYLKPKKSSSRTTSECSTRSDEGQINTETNKAGEVSAERLGPVEEDVSVEPDSSETGCRLLSVEDLPVCDKSSKAQSECINQGTEPPDSSSPVSSEMQSQKKDSVKQISDFDSIIETKCNTTENENLIDNHSNSLNNSEELQEGDIITAECLEEDSGDSSNEESDDDDGDDDDDDDEGWITPSNIKSVKQKMGMPESEKASVPVGCLTTDFAMQNVLIQMGLNVISVDGMLIKRAKSFVLRCFACMKITTNVQKIFCPHCGNKTLTKVSMTVNEDGSIRYFLSRRPISKRGTKFPLPLPKGGKHAVNPYLVEDQPHPQQRTARKAQNKLDVFNPDYVANQSPFAINDVTSRAAQLGIRVKKGQTNYWEKRNPNAARKRIGRRK